MIKIFPRSDLSKEPLFFLFLASVSFVVPFFIANEKYFLILTLAGLICYFILPLEIKMLLLVLGCFFPLSFGDLHGISAFQWFEWMGPLMFCLCLHRHTRTVDSLFPRENSLFIFAMSVFLLWAIINYILHPVSAEKLLGAGEERGGIRAYYNIFIGACIFFCAIWFGHQNDAQNNWMLFLKIILFLSIILGISRIFSYFLQFNIPLVYGTYRYEITYLKTYSGMAHRIGGLSDCAVVGIPALLALRYRKPFQIKHILFLSIFAALIFLSGGRSASVGISAAVTVYAVLIDRQKLTWFFSGIFLITLVFAWLIQFDVLSGQLSRLSAYKGGLQVQDPYRWKTFNYMWQSFLNNPLLGKGIGYSKLMISDDFVRDQLKSGGHGSYISILSTFGVGGLFFLVTMLFVSLFRAFSVLIQKRIHSDTLNHYLVFMVLFLIIRSVENMVGGNGYSDMTLYLLAGSFVGLVQFQKKGSL
jgi:hypothetical protein